MPENDNQQQQPQQQAPQWSPDIPVNSSDAGDLNIRTTGDLLAAHNKLRDAAKPGSADTWFPAGDLVLGGTSAQEEAKGLFMKSDHAKRVTDYIAKNPQPQREINRAMSHAYGEWTAQAKRDAENKTAMDKVIQERFGGKDNYDALVAKVKEKNPEVAKAMGDAFIWQAFTTLSEFGGAMKGAGSGGEGGTAGATGGTTVAPADAPTLKGSFQGADGKPVDVDISANYKSREAMRELFQKYGGYRDNRVKVFLDQAQAKQMEWLGTDEGAKHVIGV